MSRGQSSSPTLRRLGAFQGSIERFGSVIDQACNHNLGRNVRVLQVLAALRILRASGAAQGRAECTKAVVQHFRSSDDMVMNGMRMGAYEAAHFLPGTLRIGGQPIWRLAPAGRVRDELEFLFGEVEHLPVAFNQADSRAEAKGQPDGLCAALVAAADALAGTGTEALRAAWNAWHAGAMRGLRTAAAAKAGNARLPALVADAHGNYDPEVVAARGEASASVRNNEAAIGILHYYAADQQQRGWDWVLGPGRSAIAEVDRLFGR